MPPVIRSKQERNSRAGGWMKQPHGNNSTTPDRAEAAKRKAGEVDSPALTGFGFPGSVLPATADMEIIAHIPYPTPPFRVFFCRRPRRESPCGPAGAGPSEKPSRLAIDNRCPSTDKPGARKAGGADRRNRKPRIAAAIGPRHGFLIRLSPPPDRVCPTARFAGRPGKRGRLVLCLKQEKAWNNKH